VLSSAQRSREYVLTYLRLLNLPPPWMFA
jgi:hypothetical protein